MVTRALTGITMVWGRPKTNSASSYLHICYECSHICTSTCEGPLLLRTVLRRPYISIPNTPGVMCLWAYIHVLHPVDQHAYEIWVNGAALSEHQFGDRGKTAKMTNNSASLRPSRRWEGQTGVKHRGMSQTEKCLRSEPWCTVQRGRSTVLPHIMKQDGNKGDYFRKKNNITFKNILILKS